jgi:hypothetical protein
VTSPGSPEHALDTGRVCVSRGPSPICAKTDGKEPLPLSSWESYVSTGDGFGDESPSLSRHDYDVSAGWPASVWAMEINIATERAPTR